MKQFLIAIFIIFSCLAPTFSQALDDNVEFSSGKVLEIVSTKKSNIEGFSDNETVQIVKLKILKGNYKGQIVEVENHLSNNPAFDINVEKGMRVVLNIEPISDDEVEVYIADIERTPAILMILGLFFVLIMAIGGLKGLKSIVSLAITSGLVLFCLVPLILKGFPIIITSVIVAIIATFATMFIVGGINKKSLAASIGTIGGVTVAGTLSLIIINSGCLTGFSGQESIILYGIRPDLDFKGLLTGAMIIAALGATMDVGMSISSSMSEIKKANESLTMKQLIASGINIGKDIMGTMTNTLILAYVGGAFPLILLASNVNFYKLINLNAIATEITSALAGSIGIVLCVPITALVSGYLFCKKEV